VVGHRAPLHTEPAGGAGKPCPIPACQRTHSTHARLLSRPSSSAIFAPSCASRLTIPGDRHLPSPRTGLPTYPSLTTAPLSSRIRSPLWTWIISAQLAEEWCRRGTRRDVKIEWGQTAPSMGQGPAGVCNGRPAARIFPMVLSSIGKRALRSRMGGPFRIPRWRPASSRMGARNYWQDSLLARGETPNMITRRRTPSVPYEWDAQLQRLGEQWGTGAYDAERGASTGMRGRVTSCADPGTRLF
jgi:hypothetical protein